MPSTLSRTGSAERWGPLWGARAEDWAACEDRQTPTYAEALRRLDAQPGMSVLDVGCGSGRFLQLAAAAGLEPSGLDASERLIAVARTRVPHADLRVGEMEALPFGDDGFDVVTGFNAFFFAADMVAALREARRVTRPGGRVLVQVWGRPERNDLEPMKAVARRFFPPPPGAGASPRLWQPGVLETLAETAGLTPAVAFDVRYAFEYPDEATLARELTAPMGLAALAGDREPELRADIVAACAPYRRAGGRYRLHNEFRALIATA
ncbi:MAG TPA: class I SAM-dependent methyltransferase [Solirubrobacteraceae bacterium]|nr:class I SAM-dependent methyltransferase [Solirubrobacteraceae bacterium]